MLRILTIFTFLVLSLNIFAQNPSYKLFPPSTPPKANPDTLYFDFDGGIQLIVIDCYDTWNRQVAYKELTQPRGLTWASVMGPAPKNIYIIRNKAGEILKVYNSTLSIFTGLKNTDYINTSSNTIYTLQDYNELNKHLMIYDTNNKVGLINLKGEVLVPTVYDAIRKYQDDNRKRDKLIIYKDGMFGFLDSNLKVLFPPIYRTSIENKYSGYPEHNVLDKQYIKVCKNEKYGLINENGKILIDFMFDDIKTIHDGIYMCVNYKDENGIEKIPNGSHWDGGYKIKTCTLLNRNFSIITVMEKYDYIYYWGIKRFIVKRNNKFGVIDHKGQVVVPLVYDKLISQNGDYSVYKDNKWGVLNLEGKVVLPIQFEGFEFYGQAIYVTQQGLIGVYTDKYKLIAKPQFKTKTWDMGKYVLTREDGSKAFVMHLKNDSYYQSQEEKKINF